VFTGIVEEVGEVLAVGRGDGSARITVRGPTVTADVRRGGSIAVDGVCLTVTEASDGVFSADVMGETLARSGLGGLVPGDPVNLERPMRLADRVGGHLVQGHVDGTGTITERRPAGDWEVVRISMPPGLMRYVVLKGSVAVDGVSLTVSGLGGGSGYGAGWIEVSLIPETLARTTIGAKRPGATVNLEVDMIAKYVERLVEASGPTAAGRPA
jgi:riboflavin synthase